MDFLGRDIGTSQAPPYHGAAGSPPPSWLEYTIMHNPNGVMLVLSRYGYVGWMAPRDTSELLDACQLLIERYGDKAIEDLLHVHPEYDILRSVPTRSGFSSFLGALGGEGNFDAKEFLKSIDRRIIIGAGIFLVAYILID